MNISEKMGKRNSLEGKENMNKELYICAFNNVLYNTHRTCVDYIDELVPFVSVISHDKTEYFVSEYDARMLRLIEQAIIHACNYEELLEGGKKQ